MSLTLTDRSERHGVQGGGACPAAAKRKRGLTFCRPGTNFIEHYACRAESPDMRSIVRGTNCLGARNLSRYRVLIVCRCALCPPQRSKGGCPDLTTITNLSREQEQKLRSPALRGELRDETPPGGAKTMTTCPETSGNNLPILSVLGGRSNLFSL